MHEQLRVDDSELTAPAPQVRSRPPRWFLLVAASLAVAVATATALVTAPSQVDAALAGTWKILDVPQKAITNASAPCAVAEHCIVYPVTLTNHRVFQVQADRPTTDIEIGLYDEFGTSVQSLSVSAGDSDWMSVSTEADARDGLGVEPVVRPGSYKLMVGTDNQGYFSLYAFEIPNSLKVVSSNAVVRGEFNDRTTRRISGKYTSYSDGVAFNAKAGATIAVSVDKPGDSDVSLTLYDSFRNEVASGSTTIDSYVIPFSGLYQLFVSGDTQGKFTIRITDYSTKKSKKKKKKVARKVAVKKVLLSKKKVTLHVRKKTARVVKLTASVRPKKATAKKITWRSSNRKVAKVSKKGKVTAVKRGRAKVTAKAPSGAKASATIVVKR